MYNLFALLVLSDDSWMIDCPILKYSGIPCLGCGMQRSIALLLDGELIASLKMYPPLYPLIFMILFLPLHLKYDFKHGASVLKWTYALICSLMVINYLRYFI